MTDKEKIKAEIKRRIVFQKECIKNSYRLTGKPEEEIILEYKQLLSFIDSLQEEPVSKDLEKENKIEILANIIFNAAKHGYMPYDTQDEYCAMEIARKNIDKFIVPKKREEPVGEDLGEYINELSKQFPEVSFAKLSRIAVRVAKWQKEKDDEEKVLTYKHGFEDCKEQMMTKAIDAQCFGFQGAALFSFRLPADNYLIGSEVKVIVVKED